MPYSGRTISLTPIAVLKVWSNFGTTTTESAKIPVTLGDRVRRQTAFHDDVLQIERDVRWLETWASLTGAEKGKACASVLGALFYVATATYAGVNYHVKGISKLLIVGTVLAIGGCGRALRQILSAQIQVAITGKPDLNKNSLRACDIARFRARVHLDEATMRIVGLNWERYAFDRDVREGPGHAVTLYEKTFRNVQPGQWQKPEDEVDLRAGLEKLYPAFKFADNSVVVDRRIQVQLSAPGYPAQVYTAAV
jgi:hypothetical protein